VENWGSYSFLFGPLVAVVMLVVLTFLLRWTFGRGRSLVERPGRRGTPADYGLLVPVADPPTVIEAEIVRRRLEAAGIRATMAPTTLGPRVMVFGPDEQKARALLAEPLWSALQLPVAESTEVRRTGRPWPAAG